MSAIFGILNLDGGPANFDHLARMRDALHAHGPDGGEIWTDGCVGLGQRLMRFTPEDSFERQPLAGCGGKVVLACDARIDNRPELTGTFGLPPGEAAVLPDSAFIMRAYEKWGPDCVLHLAGEFAFALWDARSQSLFAACSPLGERPLHYHQTPHSFAFATMPCGLLALPTVPRVLNEDKVADYLAVLQRTLGTTFYKDIFRLRGGHSLTAAPGGVKITRYWNPDWTRRIRFKNDDDYVEAFVEVFDRAVNDCLRSATPIGISMSGGLDSSSVGVTAAGLLQRQGARLSAYTEVPRAGFTQRSGGRYTDETPYVQAIANRYSNIDLNLIHTDGQFFLTDLPSYFQHAELPFRNTSNRVWMETILRTAHDQGRRVLLTGAVGNLTVSWNGGCLLPELLREGKWRQALRESMILGGGTVGGGLRKLAGKGLLPLLPKTALLALIRRTSKSPRSSSGGIEGSPIHPSFAAAHGLEERLRDEDERRQYAMRTDMREFRFQFLAESDLMANLTSGYRAMFGVESRDPTADLRVMQYCLAVPEEQFSRNGRTRDLLRRAMKDRWPAEIGGNTGKGRQAADWYERQAAARPAIAEELDRLEQSEGAKAMLDLAQLRHLAENAPAADSEETPQKMEDYYHTFQQGLMVGRFIRWFEEEGQSSSQ